MKTQIKVNDSIGNSCFDWLYVIAISNKAICLLKESNNKERRIWIPKSIIDIWEIKEMKGYNKIYTKDFPVWFQIQMEDKLKISRY